MADPKVVPSYNHIVVLGGSFGGVSIAHYLLKHAIPQLPESNTFQIVMISTSSQALLRQACPRALISDNMFPQDKLFVDIQKQFEQYAKDNFRFIQASATRLDHAKRTISYSCAAGVEETIDFHALVVATGASTPSPLLSLNGDEKFLRESWEAFRTGLLTAKSIVVAGGGPAGIEVAGELGESLNGRNAKQESPNVAITVYTAASKILPVLRPSLAKKAEDYLAQVGVKVVKNARVQAVEPAGAGTDDVAAKATVTLADGKKVETDLYVPAVGMRPNVGFVDAAILGKDGRIEVNASTLRVDKAGPRIYAIGDVASHARPAVHNILDAIPVLGANMKRDLLLCAGRAESSVGVARSFKEDRRETQLVPIGRSKGVGSAMGYQVPSWLVWLIKGRDYWMWTTGNLWNGKQWAKEA